MGNTFRISEGIVLILTFFLLLSCKKDKSAPPVVTTTEITTITQTTALSGGNITDDNGGSVIASGVCWASATIPTTADFKASDGIGKEIFTSSIVGLTPNTSYNLRAYATNSAGTGYGTVISFTTKNYGEVTDIDGNVYRTITIGKQTWMAENLRVTKYNDGTLITYNATPYTYNNTMNIETITTYGRLYNWNAVSTQKLAPVGWRVPTYNDIITLSKFLGNLAGGKMKVIGTILWLAPNEGATNECAFNALPAGIRNTDGTFSGRGTESKWWCSTQPTDHYFADFYQLQYDAAGVMCYFAPLDYGCSVRCIRNN